ncbi:unnamed protein product [Aspergillus oryzae]|uniref:Unnamed protein product n=2 Tax=Aspergillus oryzae TaxID=5062 RepID=A0AAN4YYV5_ASPOZ|nr:unnamed protein product [Aspergillus oryzae]GMF96356.1 unnamed protein product [Aspergillus oryzae]GMG15277.1 unnamed protein product [Aspergillus oryzae]GMG37872.1 unnamed protein product [Aspergillus oryzae]GMG52859.1 unnamed protein product [Aspergillus oryzae var. brunneus]
MNPERNAEDVPDDEASIEAAPLIHQAENETVVPPGQGQPNRRLGLVSTTFLMSVSNRASYSSMPGHGIPDLELFILLKNIELTG